MVEQPQSVLFADRGLPAPIARRSKTVDLGFIPDPNRLHLCNWATEALCVAGSLFAGGVLPALVVVLCFAGGA